MNITQEFQPYFNKELNQPRTCIWIKPENISELKLLEKINNSIMKSDKIQSGFTGIEKDVLLIQIPL